MYKLYLNKGVNKNKNKIKLKEKLRASQKGKAKLFYFIITKQELQEILKDLL